MFFSRPRRQKYGITQCCWLKKIWITLLLLWLLWQPEKSIFPIKLVPNFSNSGWQIGFALSWSFFVFSSHHKFSIGLRSGLFHTLFEVPFLRKSFNTLCSVARFSLSSKKKWRIHHQTHFLWNEKSVPNINVHLHIECWGNDCHLLWLFTSHAALYYKVIYYKIWLFSSGRHLYVSSEWSVFFVYKSQFIQPVSNSSVIYTDFCFHLLFFICFMHFLFSRHVALSFISWHFGVFLGLPLFMLYTF